jgi:dihydrofolate synthase/folylpolyglutamate synthase
MTRAADIKAPVLLIGQEYEVEDFTRLGLKARASFRVGQRVWRDVEMNSPAAFMATNAAHALAAYDTLRRRGLVPDLDEAALRTVFEQIELSTCCEVVHGAPVVLLDGAHNASAAASLAAMLRSTFEGRRHVLVISIDPKKEYEKMVRHLADAGADRAIFTICPRGDSVPPQVLAELWRSRTAAAAEVLEDPDVAFSRAVLAAGSEGQVVVTGSTQLAGYCWRLAKAIAAGRVGRESI